MYDEIVSRNRHQYILSFLKQQQKFTSFVALQKKDNSFTVKIYFFLEAVVAVIVWQLDLQLPMQSVPITTDVVNSNLDQGKVYNNM